MPDDVPTIGPMEFAVIVFPGTTLDPRVVGPVKDLVDAGTVRLLDAAVVHKAGDGTVTGSELEAEDVPSFDAVDGEVLELLNEEDLAAVGDGLDPGTTGLVLVWEDRWATALAVAVRRAGGVLAVADRVPPDRAEAALRAASAKEVPA